MMNSLGQIFKVTSYGESHGAQVGCLIEGCPAGLSINLERIQAQVNRRKTNQGNYASTRQEDDIVNIVSGVFEGKTTGSPIAIFIENKDMRSADYDELKHVFRPGHADLTYHQKYQWRDHRGGGRSSIRITAPMVAAGEIALQLLQQSMPLQVIGFVSQIGDIQLPKEKKYHQILQESPNTELRCPDELVEQQMLHRIEQIKEAGDTLGGSVSCVIKGLNVGIGEPIFGKMQAQLAHAMMSINTAKGFEYGAGFESASMLGSEHNDSILMQYGKMFTADNKAGGVLGGISNGEDIYFKVYFKPISSIQHEQTTSNDEGEVVALQIKGRHDVCAVPRAVPIVEAYTNIVLADLFLHAKLSNI